MGIRRPGYGDAAWLEGFGLLMERGCIAVTDEGRIQSVPKKVRKTVDGTARRSPARKWRASSVGIARIVDPVTIYMSLRIAVEILSIHIFSHDGRRRALRFKVDGLDVITGRSSTGKSALSEIIEYCMGRSSFNVPEGIIRDKVTWFAVIYPFENEQVLVAKPTPPGGCASCSAAMLRRGGELKIPEFKDLAANTDDDSIVELLSRLLGIPENRTEVALEHSRESYDANVKHTFYYLFQKAGLVANKDQLFYRQNEQFQPQAIRDTLPILLGVSSQDRWELKSRASHRAAGSEDQQQKARTGARCRRHVARAGHRPLLGSQNRRGRRQHRRKSECRRDHRSIEVGFGVEARNGAGRRRKQGFAFGGMSWPGCDRTGETPKPGSTRRDRGSPSVRVAMKARPSNR